MAFPNDVLDLDNPGTSTLRCTTYLPDPQNDLPTKGCMCEGRDGS